MTPLQCGFSREAEMMVLCGFNSLFRASAPVTYNLLFNALLLEKLDG